MGTDKALVRWRGVPLLQRVVSVALQCSDQVAILTPWPDRYRSVLPAGDRYTWLAEAQPHGGPLVALTQGLDQLASPWVLLLACDLPQLCPLTLNQWRGLLPGLPSSTLALVPHQPQGWEPLCGFYRRSVQVSLQAFQAEGGRSFQAWLDQVPVQAMEFTSPSPLATMLWNCNDPTQCNP
jgi:molybdopterin-guanine dinucleotide biosynthesis protein A